MSLAPHSVGSAQEQRRTAVLAGLALALMVFAAYANSFSGPFVYDDIPAIVDNTTLREWWRLDHVLLPPKDATVNGRPLLNLSLALNYACGGTAVAGYHLVNVLIHVAAALVLFGLVRRTLLLPALRVRFAANALPLAFAASALWALHPLQTEAINYVVQRAESLMSLFFLLTLYGFVHSAKDESVCHPLDDTVELSPRGGKIHCHLMDDTRSEASRTRWPILSVIACACGMATKENMAAAPLLVLLFDRTFVAGSFSAAWARRARFYLALGATWLLLAALVASTGGNRGGSVGFGTHVSFTAYWLTQFPAIIRYLTLSAWPQPLVFDYGTFWIERPLTIVPEMLAVGALVAAVLVSLRRRPALGFVGVWFFAILAPTSLLPGTTQMIVEHRVYLPLAAVMIAAVLGTHALAGRRGIWALGVGACALGMLTFARNTTYRSEITLWADTVTKRPQNAQAHFHLAGAFLQREDLAAAAAHFERAAVLAPGYTEAHNNLGTVLRRLGRPAEALTHFEQALQLAPNIAETHNNAGNALAQLGRSREAITHYERAIQLRPDYAEAQANLADTLVSLGRSADALPYFARALQLHPELVDLRANYANALADSGRLAESIMQFQQVLRAEPGRAEAHYNYASVLHASGRTADAISQFEEALRLRPDLSAAREALAELRAETAGRKP